MVSIHWSNDEVKRARLAEKVTHPSARFRKAAQEPRHGEIFSLLSGEFRWLCNGLDEHLRRHAGFVGGANDFLGSLNHGSMQSGLPLGLGQR